MKPVLIFAMFCGTLAGQTTFWVEQRTRISGNHAIPRVDGLMNTTFTPKLGAFVWFQTQNGYSQSYGGITYSLKPWIQLAVGPGLEQAGNPARVGGYVWMGNSRNQLLMVIEHGGSGPWYKVEGNRRFGGRYGIGFLAERYLGAGPRFEVAVPKTRLKIWGGAFLEHQRVKGLLGIRFTTR